MRGGRIVSTRNVARILFLRLQRRDDAEILERARVAFHVTTRGDLLEDAAHDFSAAGFRQARGKANRVRLRQRTNLFANVRPELLLEFFARSYAGLDGDE